LQTGAVKYLPKKFPNFDYLATPQYLVKEQYIKRFFPRFMNLKPS